MSAMLHLPILVFLGIYYAALYISDAPILIPTPFIMGFCISYSVGILIGMIGARRAGKAELIPAALMMPVYWIVLFPPTLRALWELRRQPFHWHKTDHGAKARPNSEIQLKPTPEYDSL